MLVAHEKAMSVSIFFVCIASLLFPSPLSSSGRSAFALLQRMLSFVQSLQYYMCYEVLEPNWNALERALSQVTTIDEVLARHNDFLDRCLRDCMLTNREVLQLNHHILQTSLTLSSLMQDTRPPLPMQALVTVQTHEQSFTHDLAALLSILNDLSRLSSEHTWANMVSRLDYNSFYSKMN